HLFEHMMFQGSKHTGVDVHFPILEELGADDVNGTTNSDRTNYYEVVPREHLETALWLESDRMGYLLDSLTEASFRNQVDVVRNERRQRYDNTPYGAARFAIAKLLYPEGHPYRYLTIGLHEDLDKASLEDVRSFFKRWYVPSNATLVLAGSFDVAQAKALVQKWFGSFPKIDRPARRPVAAVTLSETQKLDVPDPFAKLPQEDWVWPAPGELAEGSFELGALAEVLGANGWGRLYQRLVVKEPLCAVVAAYHDARQDTGEFHVIARLKPGADRARVEAILREELQRAIDTPVTAEELHRVVLSTESDFIWGLAEVGDRADQLQWFNHYAHDPGYAAKYLERLRAVTPESIQAAAKAWLDKPHVEVVSVPKAAGPPGGDAGGDDGGEK
ncbi:MAG: insulinase family protein, partial [Myxococcales bacterium]|nr:insulinase family protein [Myxococcales bacterium]